MSEDLLLRHCAPTLAGMKAGSLFPVRFTDRTALWASIRQYNRRLGKKGLRILPLKWQDGRALIYVYRPQRLHRDLMHRGACPLLHRCGYDGKSTAQCLAQLARRIREQEEFPHEIGLFLSYPPDDVAGFLDNAPCKGYGLWKVYGDMEDAQRTFARYRKCSRVYSQRYACGACIERLTVAERDS